MTSRLLDVVRPARIVLVAGKGGVGKTTAAGALALAMADAGIDTHLISTDPAHSIGDLFGSPINTIALSSCSARLTLEEFDASAHADAWLARSLPSVSQIIEGGTYLDADDVAGFSRLALPGIDEMMAVLRLTDLARAARAHIVIDTAPTGHTLRLLDAAATYDGIANALRAMADKAAAVAGSMIGTAVRLKGESIIDEFDAYVRDYHALVLGPARVVVATRAGGVVAAETARLCDALDRRGLHIAATVSRDGANAAQRGMCVSAPTLRSATGCDALRAWIAGLTPCVAATPVERSASHTPHAGAPAIPWLEQNLPPLVLFAGKGGVGKTSCAAATALALAATRSVLLCSTDPAGSLDDVLGMPATSGVVTAAPGLRVMQVQAELELERLRTAYRDDALAALDRVGLSGAAALDRRVIEALWSLAPPGVDELLAVIALLDAAQGDETIIIDSAPTGHFLRLLTMPDIALEWTHQLMRVIVKYGISGQAGGTARTLLRIARELRALDAQLHDGAQAGVVVVTLDEPMVRAETERLCRTLRANDVRLCALAINRGGPPPAAPDAPVLSCPEWTPPLVGVAALREWSGAWKIVA